MYILVIKPYITLAHNFFFNIYAHEDGRTEDGRR